MPIHDWSRVDAGIFHHFHHRWISAIADTLNQGLLPNEYYALAEQQGAGFEPDVMALKRRVEPDGDDDPSATEGRPLGESSGGLLVAQPRVTVTAETDLEFYRRKQNVVAVRHVSGDHLVAIVEVVSKGNKSGRKAAEFLSRGIHLLILDIQELAVGDTPIKMFLEPGRYVEVPIEETYRLAFESVPRRWRMVLEPG
jgi:hypothetical protein